MTALRHMRNGPDIDVALCGERDDALFVMSSRLITCPKCIEKRAALVAGRKDKVRTQIAARQVQWRERLRTGVPGFYRRTGEP